MAYAVFKTGGKQYRVSPGDVIEVEKLDGEDGAELTFAEVLMTGGGEDGGVVAGSGLKDATVVAKVVEQFKAKKVIAFKYRRRKGYHRTVGHRRKMTRLEITAINA